MQSESIDKLAAALVKFQGVVQAARMDTENPFFKSKYADLGSVWDAARQHLQDNGLAITQTNVASETGIVLRTTLMHTSGQWIAGEIFLPPTKKDPQQYGSAMTYARRYGMAAILGMVQDDDDGNAASQPPPKPQQKKDSPHDIAKRNLMNAIKGCKSVDELGGVYADHAEFIEKDMSNDERTKFDAFYKGKMEGMVNGK